MDIEEASKLCQDIFDEMRDVVIAEDRFFAVILVGLLADGHVLVEDVPGTGKTLSARTLASITGLDFKRIQFTPDLLPSDVTGTYVFNEESREFEFNEGPVFANVVLADEINRSPPKTQAALLEAMAEQQVTVSGETHNLPDPFLVLATQNPVEQGGTFQLPEAQLDRFMLKTTMGYPDREGALELLDRRASRESQTPTTETAFSPERIAEMQRVLETVRVEDPVRSYMVDIIEATREDARIEVGVSPRGLQRLFEAARASAVIEGRSFTTPGDVKSIAPACLTHRLVLTSEATVRDTEKADVMAEILRSIDVPR
jgi:MoxR-like ATPase